MVLLVALSYVALYQLNSVLMGTQAFNGVASLLFLPAFVRFLGFLLIGFWSVPGLFIAALLCVDLSLSPISQVIVSLLLALGAPTALWIASKTIAVRPTLDNLTSIRLLILSVAAALGSGAAYHIGLTFVGAQTHSLETFCTAAFGDAAGTWAVIYLLKLLLTLASRLLASKA